MGMEITDLQEVSDLTTRGCGVDADADPLVLEAPKILDAVPGKLWRSRVAQANAIVRMPTAWNGKLIIGATPAVRSELSLDLILSDIVLQRGYAFAACDKGTPGLTLRDRNRSIQEWEFTHVELVSSALQLVQQVYGKKPQRTYICGLSNGGYVTRMMMERHADLFDGGLEWEGVLWHPETRHLLTTLPVYVADYPVYCNWRGDRTASERSAAYERLLDAGLHPASEAHWHQYFLTYWVVSLWLYAYNLDPAWRPFRQAWTNEWLSHPDALATYPWQARQEILAEKIAPFANTGRLQKPFLSVAGNQDCLVPHNHHAKAYVNLVERAKSTKWHRAYEIDRGNHVDGLLRGRAHGQQPVQPYFEACLYYLEQWVEAGILPPASAKFSTIESFAPSFQLYSQVCSTEPSV